mmetsp:Transcript_3704/g.7974  ORF Transcript_3704/g.7974 Transcript_3704/m.7974 type:complete len:179 (+) Transcript_3704:587-1123(+)
MHNTNAEIPSQGSDIPERLSYLRKPCLCQPAQATYAIFAALGLHPRCIQQNFTATAHKDFRISRIPLRISAMQSQPTESPSYTCLLLCISSITKQRARQYSTQCSTASNSHTAAPTHLRRPCKYTNIQNCWAFPSPAAASCCLPAAMLAAAAAAPCRSQPAEVPPQCQCHQHQHQGEA